MIIFLKKVLRLFHRKMVECYVDLLSIKKHILWTVQLKKHDTEILNQMIGNISLKPIHFRNWHFGTRFMVANTIDRKLFIKILSDKQLANREIGFYKGLDKTKRISKYVPQYITSQENEGNVYLVLEYIEGSSLDTIDNSVFSIDEKKYICSELYSILDGLSEIGYAHNDIRLGNLILRDGIPILFDFGYACKCVDVTKMLQELTKEERIQLNEYNRIAYDNHNDAFSMYYVMKYINPSLLSNQNDIWHQINERIDDSYHDD